jgi:hypothetical protein
MNIISELEAKPVIQQKRRLVPYGKKIGEETHALVWMDFIQVNYRPSRKQKLREVSNG